jgi:hypothetical protein
MLLLAVQIWQWIFKPEMLTKCVALKSMILNVHLEQVKLHRDNATLSKLNSDVIIWEWYWYAKSQYSYYQNEHEAHLSDGSQGGKVHLASWHNLSIDMFFMLLHILT